MQAGDGTRAPGPIEISAGFDEAERALVARLFWEAFSGKLGRLMRPEARALAFLRGALRPDFARVARDDAGRLLGVAGIKTPRGGLVAGGLRELAAAGATLLGGHTTEGAETTIGYTVIGRLGDAKPFTKGSLRAGDRLVLTKPLGTGVLLAGLPLCRTRAPWIEAALASMLASNRAAAALARELDLTAVTDVTGFGLGGHLLEMLDASGVTARLDLDALPLLPGFESLATGGVRSSLDPSNREIESRIDVARPTDRSTARYAALFDPQTSGGLLLAIPADKVTDGLRRLEGAGYADAAVVAEVVEASDEPTIRIG